ncbi:hypothetical protein [Mesorhizobium sp. M0478]|uniref:hypothetical protein n=1 Tax=Mesorhizobium sp. M0478 TaxID=2956947 RepID=UPI003337AD9E
MLPLARLKRRLGADVEVMSAFPAFYFKFALLISAVGIAGCTPFLQGPERLYAVSAETAEIKNQVGQPDFNFYKTNSLEGRRSYRNNYVTARMYAIDLAYTDYETSLTTGRQGSAFLATATSIALNTTSTLVSPVGTKDVLSGIAGGLTGAKSAYNDEVLLKSTVQLLQTQMRTNRAIVSSRILRRLGDDDASYPLPLALSDLEEYYRAGTLTGAMLKAQAVVSADEQAAQVAKQSVISYNLSTSPGQVALANALTVGGQVDRALLARLAAKSNGVTIDRLLSDPQYAALADKIARDLGYIN